MHVRRGMLLAALAGALAVAGCKARPTPSLTLSIPGEITEGETATGMVIISSARGVDTVVLLDYST